MKQIFQNLGSGETLLAEVPCPSRSAGSVLIQTDSSLLSLGTEKMLIDFGRAGYLAKARAQPDKVKQVIQKIKTDGLWTTVDAVRAKLDTPIPLGYCNVGTVVEADEHSRFAPGDRVVSNGPHAEMVCIGENLVAKLPGNVNEQTAAYTVLGAIGLQGIRLAGPTLGERFVVSGLGLIGLLVVQLLRAHGCEVMGIDFDAEKLRLAESFGAITCDLAAGEDPVRAAENWTRGEGVDGVLITASSKSDEVVHQSATMCRKRGRIVLVGVVGLNLRRDDFYKKELSFQVSCSYGPGRYDSNYEGKGLDYPIGYVRWTEQRNFEAVVAMMSQGKISTEQLTTHQFDFSSALEGYKAIHEKGALGILLNYQQGDAPRRQTIELTTSDAQRPPADENSRPVIGFIGAGGFTTRMLLPSLPEGDVEKRWIVSKTGASATHAAKKFGFSKCGSDLSEMLGDESLSAVFITTSHASHAGLICRAVSAGKDVFVEKPVAMNRTELDEVRECLEQNPERRLMVGFNRRFSPHTVALKSWLKATPGPKAVIITVNAGKIPADHWTQDLEVGGGRIIGEACHYIDLARFIVEDPIANVVTTAVTRGDGLQGDCVTIQLTFRDGSIATVHYLSNGNKAFPKERVEVFSGGDVVVIENFRKSYVIGKRRSLKTRKQDKGHVNELAAFLNSACVEGSWPIPREEIFEVGLATIDAHDQVRTQLSR